VLHSVILSPESF